MTEIKRVLCNLCLELDGRHVPVEYGVVINKRAYDLCAEHFREPLVKFEREYADYGQVLERTVRLGNGKVEKRPDSNGTSKRFRASETRHEAWMVDNDSTLVVRAPYIPSFYEQDDDDD